MAPSTLPQQIHRYRILSELGRGSMGRVYLADDPNIERRIALKILMPERLRGAGGEELRQRFLQEARAAGGLSHRGIVTIYDADTDPESGCPYLAMEWVRGCSLKALLHKEGPLTPECAVSMAAQVARALDYAHRLNVVHRDVKPANLLVSGHEAEEVKVVDFGIAKLVSKSLTQPGRVLGSPYYMAPEQVRGLKVDGRSDLFSLGAVLYECLTGRNAFSGDTVASVTHKILAVDPRPIDNPTVPSSLRAVVRRALAKLPQDRYRSGAELAAALETVGAELALGYGPGRVSTSIGTGATTTEVMRSPAFGSTETGLVNPPADVEPTLPDGGGHWLRILTLAVLMVVFGVLVGRSLAPRISGVAEGGEFATGPATSSAEGAQTARLASDLARMSPPAVVATPASSAEEALPEADPRDLEGLALASTAVGEAPASSPREATQAPLAGEETSAPSLQPAAVATTDLEIIYENRLKLAYLSVWIDGRQALSATLETKNPFKRMKGREYRWLIPVPAGERSLEIQVSDPSKQLEARSKILRPFEEEAPQRLIVELWPDSSQLGFQWESL